MRPESSIRRWYILLILGLMMTSVSCGYFVKTRLLEERALASAEVGNPAVDSERIEENPPEKTAEAEEVGSRSLKPEIASVRKPQKESGGSGFVKHVLQAGLAEDVVAEEPAKKRGKKRRTASETPEAPVAIARPSDAPESIAKPSAAAAVASVPPAQKVGLTLFLGVGINYVLYTENLSDLSTTYRDLSAPSTFMGINMEATERTSVEATHKVTPIRFDNSSVGLNGIKANWQILSLHGLTKSDVFQRFDADGNPVSEFRYLYGFQLHEMPLALFKNGTNEPVLKNIHLLNASLGASYLYYTNPWTRASILGHFQLPLSGSPAEGGASFTVRPILLFDGSIGLEKKISAPVWVGLHWYGQYQRLNFDYADANTTASGVHSVLFSNMEIRLTYDF